MSDVVAPPRFPLASDKLFNDNGSINLKNLKVHYSVPSPNSEIGFRQLSSSYFWN